MTAPRLSICMPTYNFGKFIGASLDSVIRQATDEVEIVVLDGGSTDDTPTVVRDFQRRFPRLTYCRHEQRGGIDRDMAGTVDLAKGEYCWLFSSDDFMKPGALTKVLGEIDLGLDLYLCGLTLCTLQMERLRDHRILNITSDRVFDLARPEERGVYFALAETTTAFFSFMGSLIFKKARWDSVPFDERFDGSLWAHVARFFALVPQGLRVKYLASSLLDKRGDNDSFMDKGIIHRYKMAVDGFHELASTFFGETSLEAYHIRRVVKNEFPPVRFLLNWRLQTVESGNSADLALLNEIAQKVYRDPGFKNWASLAAYKTVPIPLFRVAKKVYSAAKPYLRRSAR